MNDPSKMAETDYATTEARVLAHYNEPTVLNATPTTEQKNAALAAVDAVVQKAASDPQIQIGILIMAVALATRRLCTGHGLFDRGRRMRVIKNVIAESDKKLRKYVPL